LEREKIEKEKVMDKVDEKTAAPGSDPGTGGKGPDTPTGDDEGKKALGTPSPDEVELDENGKPLPFDKHPKWIAARQAEKKLQALMGDNDVETIEDLVELVQSGRKVIGKVNLDSLDTILEESATLRKYQEYWERQKEAERTEGEEPEDRATRLAEENAALKREKAQQVAIEENKKVIETFYSTVRESIKEALPDLPKEQSKFLEEFMGVDNPAVDVDITNKVLLNKAIRNGIKTFEKFKSQIIKDYLAGKEKIVDVQRTDTGGVQKTGEVKTLKDARKTFLSSFGL
jgi:hypothetical protein